MPGTDQEAVDRHLAELVAPIGAAYVDGPHLHRVPGVGRCLEPFLRDGDVVVIDPTRPPQHGDFVAIAWNDESFAEVLRQRQDRGDHSEAPRFAIKGFCQYQDGSAVLVNRGGFWPITAADFCGTVVLIERTDPKLRNLTRLLGTKRKTLS